MHKAFLLVAVLVLSAAWLTAQNQPQTSPSQSPTSNPSASPSSSGSSQSDTTGMSGSSQTSSSSAAGNKIQGCLQGSTGSYTLTDDAGMTYQLSGDDSKLSSHVGHEVEITGSTGSSGAGATSAGSQTGAGASAAGSAATGQQSITVEKVKMVSKTCKTAGK